MSKYKRAKAVETPLKLASIVGEFFSAIDEDFENTDVRKMTDAELGEMFLICLGDRCGWMDYSEKVIAKGEAVADSVVALVREIFAK